MDPLVADDIGLFGCGCGGGAGGGGVSVAPALSGLEAFDVRHAPGTLIGNSIAEFNEGGKKIYELQDLAILDPDVELVNDSVVTEIGATIAVVNFDGEISETTYPIVARSIVPDPGGLDLTMPFSFQKLNVKRTTPGVIQSHTLSATDNQGHTKNKVSNVVFKHAFYNGFSNLALLDQAQIKALVNKTIADSIQANYAGLKSYVVPGGPSSYIYWCGPVGTPVLAGATLGGFVVPLTTLATVDVTNIHDGSIVTTYWVIRTSNKLDPGTYLITGS